MQKLEVLPESISRHIEALALFQKLNTPALMIPLSRLTALPPDMPLVSVLQLNKELQHPWRAVMGALPSYLDGDGFARFFPVASPGSQVLTAYLLARS